MLACLSLAFLMAPITVTVHSDQVVRTDADRFFGIDLNYIRDRDSNRPEAFETAPRPRAVVEGVAMGRG